MRTRGLATLAGVAAAAVALGVAELVAVATGPRSSPLIAVDGVVIDTVPEPLKQFAIDVFGLYDKVALLTGTVVLLAAFAALFGVLSRRNRWYGFAGIALFSAVGVAAALTRHEATLRAALPSLVGGLAAAGALHLLMRGQAPEPALPEPSAEVETHGGPEAGVVWTEERRSEATGATREDGAFEASGPARAEASAKYQRRFLVRAGLLVGGAVVAGVSGRVLSTRRGVADLRAKVVLPAPRDAAPPVPANADLNIPRLASYVTDNHLFYRIDTSIWPPQVDPDTWRLRIYGRVRRPLELTFDELLARPMVERYITLCCVSNEIGGALISNARWLGVPVKDLLDEAEPLDGADQVVSRSEDGWTCGTPTAVLRDGRDALLAVGMNGEPLPISHGFPVRMVTPGLYGYVSACKWLVELELSSFADFDAYWVRRGWSAQAPIKTQSRIDVPRRGTMIAGSRRRAKAAPGKITVAGVAWAQHRGISKVEVAIDRGPWQEATLAATVSTDTWRQWSWAWDATPGLHSIMVRATDSTGETQTGEDRPVMPDGATGYDMVEITVE